MVKHIDCGAPVQMTMNVYCFVHVILFSFSAISHSLTFLHFGFPMFGSMLRHCRESEKTMSHFLDNAWNSHCEDFLMAQNICVIVNCGEWREIRSVWVFVRDLVGRVVASAIAFAKSPSLNDINWDHLVGLNSYLAYHPRPKPRASAHLVNSRGRGVDGIKQRERRPRFVAPGTGFTGTQ